MKRFLQIFTIVFLAAPGCMDQSKDYDKCLDVESARCQFRGECDDSFDVDQCIYYYSEQCRTRKLTESATQKEIDACVSDIDNLGSVDDCNRLDKLKDQNEVCAFGELASCALFLCDTDTDSATDTNEEADTASDSPEDSDTSTEITDGLNPQ